MAISDALLQLAGQQTDYSPLISASTNAGNIQSQGALAAGQIGADYLNQAIQSLQQGGQAAQHVTDPYAQAGQQTLGSLLDFTGISGQPAAQTLARFQSSPGYQFSLDQAIGALDRSAAARGKLYSGQHQKAVMDRASQLANQQYQQNINNQLALMQATSPYGLQQATQQYALGKDVGTVQSQIGEALANARLASSSALASGLLGSAQAQVADSAQPVINQPVGIPGAGANAPTVVGGSTSPWGSTVGGGGSADGSGLGSGGLMDRTEPGVIPDNRPLPTDTSIPPVPSPGTSPTSSGPVDRAPSGSVFDPSVESPSTSAPPPGAVDAGPINIADPATLGNLVQDKGSVKEALDTFLQEGGDIDSAMNGYENMVQQFMDLRQQYIQGDRATKESLDAQIREVNNQLNEMQYQLLQSGLWRV